LNHTSFGFFVQDHWQAASRLSVTYGVRYDVEAYPSQFITKRDLNNVQPRVGAAFAYSSRGVVRGGYGVFTDRLASSVGQLFNATQMSSAGGAYVPGHGTGADHEQYWARRHARRRDPD